MLQKGLFCELSIVWQILDKKSIYSLANLLQKVLFCELFIVRHICYKNAAFVSYLYSGKSGTKSTSL